MPIDAVVSKIDGEPKRAEDWQENSDVDSRKNKFFFIDDVRKPKLNYVTMYVCLQ